MDSYKIEWKRSAIKELKVLPKDVVPRIVKEIGHLAMNPYPQGVKKLSGSEHTYRIRQGSYRVVLYGYKGNIDRRDCSHRTSKRRL